MTNIMRRIYAPYTYACIKNAENSLSSRDPLAFNGCFLSLNDGEMKVIPDFSQ